MSPNALSIKDAYLSIYLAVSLQKSPSLIAFLPDKLAAGVVCAGEGRVLQGR